MAKIKITEIGRDAVNRYQNKLIFSRSSWYQYNGGVWEIISDFDVENKIWDLLELYEHSRKYSPSANAHRTVCSYMKTRLYKPEDELDAHDNLINLKNGVYNLDDNKLYPHKPEYYLTNQLSFDYDPAATCHNWYQFTETTFVKKQSTEPDFELIDFVQESIGYSLTIDNQYQKMFNCLGEGSNGKGVLYHTFANLAGNAAIPIDLDLLRREKYQLAILSGKRIAFCTETNKMAVEDATLKALVGGDSMQVRMIRREPFILKPICKVWWSMNRVPVIKDTSHGFWRRQFFIPFNRIFRDGEKDTQLKEKLVNELPGIFNWAMDGLTRLRQRGNFNVPQQVQELTNELKTRSNLVETFIQEKCKTDPAKVAPANFIYSEFKLWCLDGNYKSLNKQEFKEEMEALGYYHKRRNTGIVYEGVEVLSSVP